MPGSRALPGGLIQDIGRRHSPARGNPAITRAIARGSRFQIRPAAAMNESWLCPTPNQRLHTPPSGKNQTRASTPLTPRLPHRQSTRIFKVHRVIFKKMGFPLNSVLPAKHFPREQIGGARTAPTGSGANGWVSLHSHGSTEPALSQVEGLITYGPTHHSAHPELVEGRTA